MTVKGETDLLTIKNYLESFFDNWVTNNIWYQMVYKQSKIELRDFYKSCALISYKTCNDQITQENLPFYVWNNLCQLLNEILEEENKGQSNEAANDSYSQHMASAKSMFSSASKNFKIK